MPTITFNQPVRANRKTRKDTSAQPLKRIYYTDEDNPLRNQVKLRNPFCGGGGGGGARSPANTGTTLVTYGCGPTAGWLAAFQT